jgi:succinate dehydrogenase / fumarate reductase flavoprotein subunit
VEYVEAWDVIVIGDGSAALRAAASAAKDGATTLMMSADSLGTGDSSALDGIAAPLRENTTRSYREDTIRAGDYLCDQDIVATRVSQATRQVDLLERWGVIFRRDADGIPMVRRASGHSKPRLTGAGDATTREIQQVLEEQCFRHGVVRRGDQLPLELVHTDQSIHGIIALDMSSGLLAPLQSKAIIIADGGFEGAWTGTPVGLGLDLAMKAGLAVRDLEFVAWAPLAVKETNVIIPLGMLADGATLHQANGTEIEVDQFSDTTTLANAIASHSDAVLDARNLGESSVWWKQTTELLTTRLGINPNRQTIPIHPRISTTLGGIVTDEHGRAISGKWSRWFTGLYAAGDAACSGLHGAGMVAGNRLLDALAGGGAAGEHAAKYAINSEFSGRSAIEIASGACEADLDFDLSSAEGEVQRTGPLFFKLVEVMNEGVSYTRNEAGLSAAISSLTELLALAETVHIDDRSRLYNTNLLDVMRLKAAIRLGLATARSALDRTESRGTHCRTDYEEPDSEQLHHTLIDTFGNISKLALRKGTSGTWVLAPNS